MRSFLKKKNKEIKKTVSQSAHHGTCETVFLFMPIEVLFYDGIDLIQFFFRERGMSDDTDII